MGGEIEAFLTQQLPAKFITQAECNTCYEDKLCVMTHGERCKCCVNCYKTHLQHCESRNHLSYKCVCGIKVSESEIERWGLSELGFLVSELNELRKLHRL